MNHVHWWMAALSFVLGLALTLAMMIRPANTQVPLWASLGLGVLPEPPTQKPEPPAQKPGPAKSPVQKREPAKPPAMKVSAADAPTERLPVIKARPAKKKAVSKDPPTKRIAVAKDPVTDKFPAVKKAGAKRVPAAKKAPGKRVPPRKKPAAKRIPIVDDTPTTEITLGPYSPYGPGSARANLDGSGPEGWTIKGRTDSRLFYAPTDPGYDEVEAQVWFEDEDFATKAFFVSSRKSARK